MPTEAEIAWATGVFEGEGSIIFTPYTGANAGRMQRRLHIQMCDRDIVERVAAIFGGRVHDIGVRKEGWKPIYDWRVTKWGDIERILRAMLPYLGARRRARAEELLASPAGPVGRHFATECVRGHPKVGPDANVYIAKSGTRSCRTCAAMKAREKRRQLATSGS